MNIKFIDAKQANEIYQYKKSKENCINKRSSLVQQNMQTKTINSQIYLHKDKRHKPKCLKTVRAAFAPSHEIRVFVLDLQIIRACFEIWLAPNIKIRVLTFDIQSSWAEYGLQKVLCQIIFLYSRSTDRLSVLNTGSKHDFRQMKKFVYWRST